MTKPLAPTPHQFSAYQAAFHHFNAALFDGKLPPVLLNFSRHARAAGFFAPERWSPRGGKKAERVHEISLNPELLERPVKETLGTLVHEMVHHWQQTFGTPSRGGYHNKEWAAKMRTVGLEPVSLDSENGTGQRVTHKIVDGGAYDQAFGRLPPAALFPWQCAPESKKAKRPRADKVKYTCPDCEANVWGKSGLTVVCGECEVPFQEV